MATQSGVSLQPPELSDEQAGRALDLLEAFAQLSAMQQMAVWSYLLGLLYCAAMDRGLQPAAAVDWVLGTVEAEIERAEPGQLAAVTGVRHEH